MQGDLKLIVALKNIKEWQVAVLVGLLEDAVKIANWLMVVEYEYKEERMIHGGLTVKSVLAVDCYALRLPVGAISTSG